MEDIMFRRDLKFIGSLGSLNDDALSYASLIAQIKEAHERKYSEKEIILALWKTAAEGSSIKLFLEAKLNSPLSETIKCIFHLMNEKDALELFKELLNAFQEENENDKDFVVRVMTLREQILSLEDDDFTNFNLVHRAYVRAIMTGLHNEEMRIRIRELLLNKVSDDLILKEVNLVLAERAERLQKYEYDSLETYVDNDAGIDSSDESDNMKEIMDPLITNLKLMSKELDGMRRSWTEKKGLIPKKCININVEKHYNLPVSDEKPRLRVRDGTVNMKRMMKVDEKAQRTKEKLYKDVLFWFEKRMRLWEESHPKLPHVDNMSNRLFRNNVLGSRLN